MWKSQMAQEGITFDPKQDPHAFGIRKVTVG